MGDMITSAVGGRVVRCNDEFFADAANLLNPNPPVWDEHRFTDRGKWMDGWETRRRRDAGHDWCILALGVPGRVETVIIDTSHFTGNYAEEFSLEACGVGRDEELDSAEWVEILPSTPLDGDSVAEFGVSVGNRVTYVRLNIFPDGGVARLKVDGTPIPDMGDVCPEQSTVDLASQIVGGTVEEASDAHYSPPSNMIRPNDPKGMWDGWETRRRRGPGFDWAVFELGLPGVVEEFVVDTRHFKGNAPGWVSMAVADDDGWNEVASREEVQSHTVNRIRIAPASATRVKLEIHPDGGVARFRVLGRPRAEIAGKKQINYLNSLFDQAAASFFNTACASAKWGEMMKAARPFADVSSVFAESLSAFDALDEGDWLEAFSGHPRIGERGDPTANREQATATRAAKTTVDSLAEVNTQYEEKFGFIFIVYATGKTADEILEIAVNRLHNNRDDELRNAASQQKLITETRLHKMLCQEQQ